MTEQINSGHKYGVIIPTTKLPDVKIAHQVQEKPDLARVKSLPLNFNVWSTVSGHPPVYDQGNANDCVGNGVARAGHFCFIHQKITIPGIPSRLFVYYNARAKWMGQNPISDTGTYVRAAIVEAMSCGYCFEAGNNSWPYNLKNINIAPPANCYTEGQHHEAMGGGPFTLTYINQDLNSLKSALVDGYPIVGTIMVYSSFENPDVTATGIVPLPDPVKDKILGGHCVLFTGYDSTGFIFDNSWGPHWGKNGTGHVPYEYLTNEYSVTNTKGLSWDMWQIKKIGIN